MTVVGHVPGRELLSGTSYLKELLSLGIGAELQITSRVLDSLTFKDYGLIKMELGERPITVHAPFIDLNPGALDSYVLEATRRRFSEVISVAKVLNARVIVFHTGYHPQKVDPVYESWFKRALETFKGIAREFNGKVALENVFDYTPDNLLRFLRELPPKVGVCLDLGHLNLFSKVPLSDWIESFRDRIYEFHVHDNLGSEDSHGPIGSGSFDFDSFFNLLSKVESKYIFNLESKSISDIRESLRRLKWKGKSLSTPTSV
ncbi:sugar phosphate isomerase/epimerase family protein [Thermovibrio sp.]